jgi:hypothetical protein
MGADPSSWRRDVHLGGVPGGLSSRGLRAPMLNLRRMIAKKYLYQLYSERVASMRLLPFDPQWDRVTSFETK